MNIDESRRGVFAFPQAARRFVSVLLCAVMLAGALLAVGRDGAQADTNLSVGIGSLGGLDPALEIFSDSLLVTNQIYDTLITVDSGSTLPKPGIAQSWAVSADGLTWTFTIRPGLKFQDGTDLNAAAVLANLQRWWDPANLYHSGSFLYFSGYFGGFKGDPSCLITGLSSPAAGQVQITLKNRFSPILVILSTPSFGIASPASLAAGTLSSLPVGSGPYQFSEWVAGDHVSLLANNAYWAGAPQVGALTFKIYASDSLKTAALAADQVQIVPSLGLDQLAAISVNSSLRAQWRPEMSIGYLGLNLGHTPLNNILVRQAIARAIDKSALIAGFYNPGDRPAGQFLPPVLMGYKTGLVDYSYDPALAHNLLVQAGYPNGFSIKLSYRAVARGYLPRPADAALAIQQYLEAIGLTVTLDEMESSVFLSKIPTGELDMYLLGWGADYPHPANFFTPIFCGNTLAFGPQDATLCGTVAAANAEPNPDAARPLYETAEQRVHDNLPLIPLVFPQSLSASRANLAAYVASPVSDSYRNVFYASYWGYLPLTSK